MQFGITFLRVNVQQFLSIQAVILDRPVLPNIIQHTVFLHYMQFILELYANYACIVLFTDNCCRLFRRDPFVLLYVLSVQAHASLTCKSDIIPRPPSLSPAKFLALCDSSVVCACTRISTAQSQ